VYIEEYIKKYLFRTRGKFRLALVDTDKVEDVKNSLSVSTILDLHLFYR
jgi:hypothetical protein